MKAVVAAFNQEKALVGAFSVIVQLHRLIVYTALVLGQVSRRRTSGTGVGTWRHWATVCTPGSDLH